MVSIACSIHPLTLKLLPSINEKISRLRAFDWFNGKKSISKELRSELWSSIGMSLVCSSEVHLKQEELTIGILDNKSSFQACSFRPCLALRSRETLLRWSLTRCAGELSLKKMER